MDRTIDDLLQHYRRVVVSRIDNPARVMNLETYLNHWSAELGGFRIVDITKAHLSEARERLLGAIRSHRRSSTLSRNSTANRYFQTLHRVFSASWNEWGWEEGRGLPRLPKLKEAKPRSDFLTPEQRVRLLQVCKDSPNSFLYPIVVIAIATGARRGEILKLRWSNIDLDRGVAIIEETKNGEALRMKFSSFPLRLLRDYFSSRDESNDLLFPSTTNPEIPFDFRKAWNYARVKAGLPNFAFHSLRHSFASDLAAEGVPLLDIATLLNHKSISTTKRYAHLTRERSDKLVEQINKLQFSEE